MKNIYQALVLDKDEQVELTLIDDTFTDAANKLSTLGFEVKALVWLEPAPEGETNRILNQSSANHATAYIKNEPWKFDTKGFDKNAAVDDLLRHFGINKNAKQIHIQQSSELFEISDISLYQALRVNRSVNMILNTQDYYCNLKYDKANRTGSYGIIKLEKLVGAEDARF